MRTGTADLPLHGGRAPRWLFERMTLLAREMALATLAEEGAPGLLRRLADPVWFQAFGCVLGFDWHSSGLTTTACGALKEGLKDLSGETGIFVAGGKGKTSRKTPQEIESACWVTGKDAAPLVRASRLSAKVDSAGVQDGFQVYHHNFFFAKDGSWAVVQQGMNPTSGMARRYHWLPPERFDRDPHAAVAGGAPQQVLNLVASEGEANRQVAVQPARENPLALPAGPTPMRRAGRDSAKGRRRGGGGRASSGHCRRRGDHGRAGRSDRAAARRAGGVDRRRRLGQVHVCRPAPAAGGRYLVGSATSPAGER